MGIFKKNVLMRRALRNEPEYPHKFETATVRSGNGLCGAETLYLVERQRHVKKALEKLIGVEIPAGSIPKISCIMSGGGLRASFAAQGFLKGLSDIGVFDALTYVVGLSGSTWTLGTLFSADKEIDVMQEYLLSRPWDGLRPSWPEVRLILRRLRRKKSYRQPVTLVDFFGALLENQFLGLPQDDGAAWRLSEQAARLAGGRMPMPIYTAISADKAKTWYEFTPFEVGCPLLNLFVPSWAYGRFFHDGVSLSAGNHFPPELDLGFHFGTFGAGFTGTLQEMYTKVSVEIRSDLFHRAMRVLLPHVGRQRVSKARVNNFMAGIAGSPVEQQRYLDLSDAGFDFNLPWPPVAGHCAERAADIVIIMDASRTIARGHHLRKLMEYATKHGLSTPPLVEEEIEKNIMTILRDEHDPSKPVFIYFPRAKDATMFDEGGDELGDYAQTLREFNPHVAMDSFCKTINFCYTADQIRQVSSLMEYNVRSNREAVLSVISQVVRRKMYR